MKRKLFTRRGFLRVGTGAAVAGAGTLGYTIFVEPFWLEFVERDLSISHLPVDLKGKTLVQISDIHVSGRVSEKYLAESFERISALDPDIVVYTGDFITLDDKTDERMRALFPKLPVGKLGTAAVLGNHDYGVLWKGEVWAQKIITMLAARGISVLRNEVLDISGLQIVGMDDLWADLFSAEEAFGKMEAERAAIVLTHNPDSVDKGGWGGYQGWILAGHTHGGQCKPPFLPPPLLPVENRRYSSGHISLGDGRELYINRALGYLHSVRFNARPEVTIFTLT